MASNEWKDVHYGVDLMKWLKRKRDDTVPVGGDAARFVFRELVQNADDANAKTMVVRLAEDALYVSNDGDAFDHPSEFERLARILGEHKSLDADKAGNFGSGFQTVFYITNAPEIHSAGYAMRLDPGELHERHNVSTPERVIPSPYADDGVVFRLPWRTLKDRKATNHRGQRPFDEEGWPVWGADERADLYSDLEEYAHHLLITCQNLESIRLLRADGSGMQVSRDFTCPKQDAPLEPSVVTMTHARGKGNDTKWSEKSSDSFQYLLCHAHATSGEKVVVAAYDQDKEERVVIPREEATRPRFTVLKRPDVWILMPLFPAAHLKAGEEGRWLHSVVPLTVTTKNAFVVSAHLFPEESRRDISVRGEAGRWCRIVRNTCIRLVARSWTEFVEALIATDQDDEDKQQALLDALPARDPADWIKRLPRPPQGNQAGAEQDDEPEDEAPVEDDADPPASLVDRLVYPTVVTSRIVSALGGWHSADKATRAHDDAEKIVLDRLHVPRLSEAFTDHPRYSRLGRFLDAVDADKSRNAFVRRWSEVAARAKTIKLGDRIGDVEVDDEFVHGLITYLTTFKPPPQDLPVAPDRTGALRPLSALARAPEPSLYEALPLQKAVHEDFQSPALTEALQACDIADVLRGLDESTTRLKPAQQVALAHAVFNHIESEAIHFKLKLNGRRNLKIIPTADGGLAALDVVRAPPPEKQRLFAALFAEAGIETTWIEEAFHTRFAGRIRDWGVSHPDYGRLAAPIDWKKRSPSDAAHFVAALVESEEWAGLQDDAPVLPFRGRLCAIRDTMLASTADPRLDAWLNTVPAEIQGLLDAEGRSAAFTRRVKATAAKPTDVVDRLQERTAWEPGRFETLSDHDWEMVTRLLKYAVEKGWNRPLGGGQGAHRILPVKHEGRVTLAALPAVRSERQNRTAAEWARRDEPWLPSADTAALPAVLMDHVQVVTLHSAVDLEQSSLRRKWGLYDLNETAIAWHFIADFTKTNELSLFREDALEAFAGKLAPKDILAIKRGLHKVARAYFDAPKATSPHVTPDDMAKIPIFYDEKGVWRSAQEIAPERTVRIKGFHPLHPDFDEWPAPTLEALGIKKRMDAEGFMGSLQEARHEGDRAALASNLATLLTDNYDLAKLGTLFAETEWVPTRDGRLRRPCDALLPTHQLIQLLGEDHPATFDMRELKDEKQKAALLKLLKEADGTALVARAQAVGIRSSHTLEDLLDAARHMMRADQRPPTQLVDELARAKFPENLVVLDVGYWDGAKWWDARRVFLRSIPTLPAPLDAEVRLVKAPHHETFLRRIGARDAPEVRDLVEWLVDPRVTEPTALGPLWDLLVKRKADITTTIRDRHAHSRIAIPPMGIRVAPASSLVDRDVDSLDIEGRTILPFASGSPEGETLRSLGAQTLDEVPTPELVTIHEKMRPETAPERTFRRVLGILATRDDTPSERIRVVCDLNGARVMRPLRNAIYPEGDAATFFREEIAFTAPGFTPKGSDFLRWAADRGLRHLSDALKEEPPADLADARPDPEAEERLRAIVAPLQRRVREEGGDGSAFTWLGSCSVRRLPRIQMTLRVDETKRTVDRACYLDGTREPVLYLPYRGPAHYYKDIIALLLQATKERGLVVEPTLITELERDLRDLLMFTRWSRSRDIVDERMPEFGEALVIVDNSTGLQYYHDRAQQFRRWYKGCQICGTRTPDGASDEETRETHTQVTGDREAYYSRVRRTDVGNYLYLCPTHQVLFKRRLVSLRLLEDGATLAEVDETLHKLEQSVRSGSVDKDRVLPFHDECEAHDRRIITKVTGIDELGLEIIEQTETDEPLTSMLFSIEHYIKYVNHVRDILQERER